MMTSLRDSALLLTLSSVAACSPALSGHLKGPNGEPVTVGSEGRVNVAPLFASPGSSAATPLVLTVEADGRFTTNTSLEKGSYLVEALVPGYAVSSRRVDLAQDQVIELRLRPIAAAKPSAIGANAAADVARGSGDATLTPPNF